MKRERQKSQCRLEVLTREAHDIFIHLDNTNAPGSFGLSVGLGWTTVGEERVTQKEPFQVILLP